MSERLPIHTGDLLYHNTAHPVESFSPDTGKPVFFGLSPESIQYIGEEGYCVTYQLIDELPQKDTYGGVQGWGQRNEWISLPAETASEILQHVQTEEL